MNNQSAPGELTFWQKAGILVFVFLCVFPSLAMNGFLFGLSFSLPAALVCATVGGAVGGVSLCPRPMLAGIVGGLLTGHLGLLAVYYYTQHRTRIWSGEIVIVLFIASLPGLGIGRLLKSALSGSSPERRPDATSTWTD